MATTPYDKTVLNEQQKIEQLKSYNVSFDNTDSEYVVQFLKIESFSFVLEYAKYAKRAINFNELVDIFYKDRELRNAIFSIIDVIETHFKTILAETLTQKDPFFYNNEPKAYFEEFAIPQITKIINDTVKKNIEKSTEEHIAYYKKYAEFPYIPFWSLIKFLSLGETYTLYMGLNEFFKMDIAKKYKMTPSKFATWLKDLSIIRNLCAHNQRLWKRKFKLYNEELNSKQLIDTLITFLNNEPFKKPNEKFLEDFKTRVEKLV